jgi:hypothetical protein
MGSSENTSLRNAPTKNDDDDKNNNNYYKYK